MDGELYFSLPSLVSDLGCLLSARCYEKHGTCPASNTLWCAGLCKDFERKLRGLNPSMATITYDVVDLYAYVDQMADISALVYAPEPNAYIPCNKEWIKKQAYLHLRNQGGKNWR